MNNSLGGLRHTMGPVSCYKPLPRANLSSMLLSTIEWPGLASCPGRRFWPTEVRILVFSTKEWVWNGFVFYLTRNSPLDDHLSVLISAMCCTSAGVLTRHADGNHWAVSQLTSLQVADNIAAFGGDPTKVTIWGGEFFYSLTFLGPVQPNQICLENPQRVPHPRRMTSNII